MESKEFQKHLKQVNNKIEGKDKKKKKTLIQLFQIKKSKYSSNKK